MTVLTFAVWTLDVNGMASRASGGEGTHSPTVIEDQRRNDEILRT